MKRKRREREEKMKRKKREIEEKENQKRREREEKLLMKNSETEKVHKSTLESFISLVCSAHITPLNSVEMHYSYIVESIRTKVPRLCQLRSKMEL